MLGAVALATAPRVVAVVGLLVTVVAGLANAALGPAPVLQVAAGTAVLLVSLPEPRPSLVRQHAASEPPQELSLHAALKKRAGYGQGQDPAIDGRHRMFQFCLFLTLTEPRLVGWQPGAQAAEAGTSTPFFSALFFSTDRCRSGFSSSNNSRAHSLVEQ